MSTTRPETIYYKRSRFSTRLPVGLLYTPAHYWLSERGGGLWRIGFTRFATRMLGDLVEYGFDLEPGGRIDAGQKIGWVEGFKAISDIYSVAQGHFSSANPALEGDITLVESDPYAEGWLYEVKGKPDPSSVDVHGYIAILDTTIDTMLRSRHEAAGDTDE